MTYRSDLEVVRERVEVLEREEAQLAGRRRGLEAATADAEERDARARAKKARVERWRRLRRRALLVVGAPVGLVIGLTCSGGIAVVGPALGAADSHGRTVERRLRGRDDAGRACTADVTGDSHDGCRAVVRCGGAVVYEGRGHCDLFFDADLVEYWDDAPPRADGTPYCLVAQTEAVALVASEPAVRVRLGK